MFFYMGISKVREVLFSIKILEKEKGESSFHNIKCCQRIGIYEVE